MDHIYKLNIFTPNYLQQFDYIGLGCCNVLLILGFFQFIDALSFANLYIHIYINLTCTYIYINWVRDLKNKSGMDKIVKL